LVAGSASSFFLRKKERAKEGELLEIVSERARSSSVSSAARCASHLTSIHAERTTFASPPMLPCAT